MDAQSSRARFVERQRAVADWDDTAVAGAVALVLGAGGIGSAVSVMLCRLGIEKLLLFDNDVVEKSNLNRQLLYSTRDVGERKASAAARSLAASHAFCTEVLPFDNDVVADWAAVVAAAEAHAPSVIFNAVDVGGDFDAAVGALCAARGVPYVAGSSYARTAIVDYFRCDGASPCPQCAGVAEQLPDDVRWRLHMGRIQELRTLTGLVRADRRPATGDVGSHAVVCTLAGTLVVNAWLNDRCTTVAAAAAGASGNEDNEVVMKEEKPLQPPPMTWRKVDLRDPGNTVEFAVPKDPTCPICAPLL